MIISDLTHLEVISEAASVTGSISYFHEYAYATSGGNGISITFPSNRTFGVIFQAPFAPNLDVSVSAPNVDVSVKSLSAMVSASASGGNSSVFASVTVHS